MKKHYRKEDNCLNCGSQLQGKFCHNCGQENLEIKESFSHMLNHAVSDYFHFDHQFFHTLKPLFFSPGKLTNEYMAGKRTQYLHPVKMYIFVSLVFFVLLFREGKESESPKPKPITKEQAKTVEGNINKMPVLSAEQKKMLINNIEQKNKNKADDDVDLDTGHINSKLLNSNTYQEYLQQQTRLPADRQDGYLKRFAIKNIFYYSNNKTAKEAFWESLKHNIPKMMFIVLPLFALILKVTFWNNRKFYVEHLIYSFHLHCFIFLSLTIIMLLGMVLPEGWKSVTDTIQFLAFFGITWYVFKSLKAVYHRSSKRTISKMIGMFLMYSFALFICFALVAAITGIAESHA